MIYLEKTTDFCVSHNKKSFIYPLIFFLIIFFFKGAICFGEYREQNEWTSSDNLECEVKKNKRQSNPMSLGKEVYYVGREKKGGTKQKGQGIGVRWTFDHIKRYCIYVGGNAFYGQGKLKGHSGNGDKIYSKLTDKQIEGNLGYTFQMKGAPHFSFTPYIGAGYYQEINKFKNPSPLLLKYTTTFKYMACGFLSSVSINPCFKIGLNLRLKSPSPCFGLIPKFKLSKEVYCKVSDDPDFEDSKQEVGSRIHYRIELPLTSTSPHFAPCFQISLVPFFEHRLYGFHENYPADFIRTTFKVYGLNLQFIVFF